MKILKSKNYRRFLEIFSDTSNQGNTDPAWSIKMWGSVDAIHDLIDLSWKNSMKQLHFTAEEDPKRIAAQNQLNDFPELDYLVQTKLLTLKPVRLVAISKMTASAEGTRTLKPNQVEMVTRYLFNLRQASPGQPDGALLNDDWNPFQVFTSPGRLIVEALRKSRVRTMEGLDGKIKK
jgi:hypothetical protein